jgi:hypothetical protein
MIAYRLLKLVNQGIRALERGLLRAKHYADVAAYHVGDWAFAAGIWSINRTEQRAIDNVHDAMQDVADAGDALDIASADCDDAIKQAEADRARLYHEVL